MEVTADLLRETFSFDPLTGSLTWREVRGLRRTTPFDSPDASGYLRVCFKGKTLYVHRIAWMICNGAIPEGMLIDHIDHNRTNNRQINLRLVTRTESNRNVSKRRTNTSGVTGVSWYKRKKKWCAEISVRGERISLGYFNKKQAAIAVRKAAEKQYEYHPNHGKDKATPVGVAHESRLVRDELFGSL